MPGGINENGLGEHFAWAAQKGCQQKKRAIADRHRLAMAQKGSRLGTEDKGTKSKPLSGHGSSL